MFEDKGFQGKGLQDKAFQQQLMNRFIDECNEQKPRYAPLLVELNQGQPTTRLFNDFADIFDVMANSMRSVNFHNSEMFLRSVFEYCCYWTLNPSISSNINHRKPIQQACEVIALCGAKHSDEAIVSQARVIEHYAMLVHQLAFGGRTRA